MPTPLESRARKALVIARDAAMALVTDLTTAIRLLDEAAEEKDTK